MYNNYKLIKEQQLKDINSEGILLTHEKSNAKVLLLKNDDEKVNSAPFHFPTIIILAVADNIELRYSVKDKRNCFHRVLVFSTIICGNSVFIILL